MRVRSALLTMGVLCGVVLLLSAVGGVSIANGAVDSIVHDALMRHPDWLFQMNEAAQQEQNLAQSAALRSQIGQIAHDPSDPFVGSPQAKVTLVEWFDYSCPYCKKEHSVVDTIMRKNPAIRVVFKEFPIFGARIPGSEVAAKAALAIWKTQPARYLAFHDAMLSDPTPEGSLTPAHVLEIARRIGCNVGDLQRAMATPEIQHQVDHNMRLGTSVRISATPSFVIDHGDGRVQIVSGAIPLDALQAGLHV